VTFPTTPLGMTVELYIDGAWVDITSLVYSRDDLVISRGRPGEGSEVERSTCRFTANNRSGNLSPRNPAGAYYGKIGRNTPVRVRLSPASESYMLMPVDLARANTPDSANLSITGDIDIRIDIQPENPASAAGLCNKYLSTGNQRSWALWLNADGTLSFRWSADGTALVTKTSTAAVSFPASGRKAVRVTLDVDNGASGNDVKFYTAPDIAGTWTQLGATVTTAGVTSIFDSTASLEIGGSQGNGGGLDLKGRLYGFEMYQGIAGTVRSEVDFDDEEAGAGPLFTDTQGNIWTMVDYATVVGPRVRVVAEVSEWPQRWDTSGSDVYVPIEASGILRRLTQGATPLKSTLYRGYTSLSTPPVAYWPCEDGADATRFASAVGGPAMTISGSPQMAQDTQFKCSGPLPLVALSSWAGAVPDYGSSGQLQVWVLLSIPSGGTVNGAVLFRIQTTGSLSYYDVSYETGGNLRLRGYTNENVLSEDSGAIAFNINGSPQRVSVSLVQNGADIDYEILGQRLDGAVGGLGGTFTAQTITRAVNVVINPNKTINDVVMGHVSVHRDVRDPNALVDELTAYNGEKAGIRVSRLCTEEGIGFRAVGDPFQTELLGPQLPRTLVDLLREAALADDGILYEPRDFLGLAYRPRRSMYSQGSALDLDYATNDLSGIEPVDDDQHVRNDITVNRAGGSSARAVKTTGPLSVPAPPGGVGKYDEELTLSLFTDSRTADQAGWRVHRGTVDEARYPTLLLDLARPVFTSDAALTLAAQDLETGDRLAVANPPAWLPPDEISQLAQGFTELLSNFNHKIGVNCAPESPWGATGLVDGGLVRYGSAGTTTNEDLTTTETDVGVAVAGPIWTHADGDFNIRVGGEVMTVTAVSGASSPQVLTVTRSVNGVVKAHLTGAAVTLDPGWVYAL